VIPVGIFEDGRFFAERLARERKLEAVRVWIEKYFVLRNR
jgi:hypothetical protein